MYTFGQYVKDKVQAGEARGEARGMAQGMARGEKRVLLKFVRQVWGDSEAERFARALDAAELRDLPDVTDLVEDQAADRRPRLQKNSRGNSRA